MLKNISKKILKNPQVFRKPSFRHHRIVLGTSLILIPSTRYIFKCNFYSDSSIEKAKSELQDYILSLKRSDHKHEIDFSEITYTLDKGKYKMSFLVDQRKVDLLKVAIAAAETLKKLNNGQEITFKLTTNQSGDKLVHQIDFKEIGGSKITYAGSIVLMGEYRHDRPSFRFYLEKNTELSDINIAMVKAAYKEAHIISDFSIEKQKVIGANPVSTSQEKA